MKNQKRIFDTVSLECSKKTTKVYSTSFSLAIKLLDKEYQKAIYSIYGYVRLADEIVDSFHDYDKAKLLNELRYSTIDALEKSISLNPIINSFQNTAKQYNIGWVLTDRFLESMEYDLNNQNCTEESYSKYIKGSAEAVALMCLKVFTYNKKNQYNQMEPYAEFLGSAFQKINFLRDMREDYHTLNRVYFPNLDITEFDNTKKKIIEEDIAKDFANGLIGIKLLDKDARKGVYLAYKYYMSLFLKIQNMDAQEILVKRIRISNVKKIMIWMYSQIEIKIKVI